MGRGRRWVWSHVHAIDIATAPGSAGLVFSSSSRKVIVVVASKQVIVVVISITPQLVAPWNRMLTCLHIACACVLMRECVPTNSLIPKLR